MFLPVIRPLFRTILQIASLVLYALTILAAYGGHINPQYFAIPAIMVMVLPYLAMLSITVTILWFLAGRWIFGGVGVLSLILAWGSISSVLPFRFSRNPSPDKQSFSLMTWNFLHGWDQSSYPNQEGNQALEYIINSDVDIVCLQEMMWWTPQEIPNMTPELQQKIKKAYPYSAFQPHIDTRVLSKYPVTNIPGREMIRQTLSPDDPDYKTEIEHYAFYKVNVKGRELLIVNCHLQSPGLSDEEREVVTDIKSVDTAKESAREFKSSILGKIKHRLQIHVSEINLMCKILKNYTGPVIVCGDFNDVPESYGWRILTSNGFHDAYSEVGFGHLITYNQHAFWLHLDQILYRGPLRPLNVEKGKIKTSDHYPVKATFEFENQSQL